MLDPGSMYLLVIICICCIAEMAGFAYHWMRHHILSYKMLKRLEHKRFGAEVKSKVLANKVTKGLKC